jgi:hypothetical protein
VNARDLRKWGQQNRIRLTHYSLGYACMCRSTASECPAKQRQHSSDERLSGACVPRNYDHRITKRATLTNPRAYPPASVQRQVEIEEVKYCAFACESVPPVYRSAVVSHTSRRRITRGISEPAQLTGVRAHQSGGAKQQRGFAGARCTDNGQRFTLLDIQIDASKNFRGCAAGAGAGLKSLVDGAELEGEGHSDR